MKKMKITIIAAALFSVSSAVSSAPMILENLQITNADGSPVAGSQWDDVRFSVDGQPVAFEGVMGENGKNYVYLDGTNATPRSYVDVLVEYGHAKHVARASWSLKTWEDGVLEDDQVDSYSVAGIKGATPYKDTQKSLWLCNFPEIHATGLQPQKVYKPQHLVYLGHNASVALNNTGMEPYGVQLALGRFSYTPYAQSGLCPTGHDYSCLIQKNYKLLGLSQMNANRVTGAYAQTDSVVLRRHSNIVAAVPVDPNFINAAFVNATNGLALTSSFNQKACQLFDVSANETYGSVPATSAESIPVVF